MPQISVIVPVYNVERYLPACIGSLRAQTLADIEILCINDASTDSSPDLLAAAAEQDPRIKVLRHALNRGLSAARNTGIRAATAPWILFVDSDDLVSRHICERTLDAAVRTQADVVFFNHIAFVDGTASPPEPPVQEPMRADRRNLLQRQAFAWTKLAKTQLLRSKRIEFPEGLCFEDVPVHWQLVIDSQNPIFLDEALVFYRQRAGSITYRSDWTRADGIKVYDLVTSRLREEGRWEAYGPLLMVAQMANFANTHAYYSVANPAFLGRVRDEARRRMTAAHWNLAMQGDGLLGWQRDYLLAHCRPREFPMSIRVIFSALRCTLRDHLRRLRHLFSR